MDYVALKSECQNDPSGIGLTTHFNAGRDGTVADLLNLVRVSISINRGLIASYEIINATVPSEWAALTANEKQRYQTLTGAGMVDSSNQNVKDTFLAMFSNGTATRTNLIALATRNGSRAEQLLGVPVSHTDIAKARLS